MHEAGVMAEALTQAERLVREGGGTRLLRLCLRVGSLSSVVPDSLRFAFEALSSGTFAEGAGFEVEWVEAACLCRDCDREFSFTENGYICPECGEASLVLLRGRELELNKIEWS